MKGLRPPVRFDVLIATKLCAFLASILIARCLNRSSCFVVSIILNCFSLIVFIIRSRFLDDYSCSTGDFVAPDFFVWGVREATIVGAVFTNLFVEK